MTLSEGRRLLVGRLRRRRTRRREALVLVEGVRSVREALAAGAEGRFAVTSPGLLDAPHGAELVGLLDETLPERLQVEDALLEELTDTRHPQGVLAVFREPATPLDALPGLGAVLVSDGIRDPGNLGTLIRAAVAFGMEGVVALEGSADPWGAKAVRSAAGMTFRLPVVRASAGDFVAWAAERDVRVLAADPRGTEVSRVNGALPWALAVGNEAAGPSTGILHAAAQRVAVPMPGPAESLNAAMAGTILLYALNRGYAV